MEEESADGPRGKGASSLSRTESKASALHQQTTSIDSSPHPFQRSVYYTPEESGGSLQKQTSVLAGRQEADSATASISYGRVGLADSYVGVHSLQDAGSRLVGVSDKLWQSTADSDHRSYTGLSTRENGASHSIQSHPARRRTIELTEVCLSPGLLPFKAACQQSLSSCSYPSYAVWSVR